VKLAPSKIGVPANSTATSSKAIWLNPFGSSTLWEAHKISANPRNSMRLLASILVALASVAPAAAQDTVRVRIETEAGAIVAELYAKQAPLTVTDFLRHVDDGFYTNGAFYRVLRDDNQPNDSIHMTVIQASVDSARQSGDFPTVPLERTNLTGLNHLDGTISMARTGPNTTTQGFFVCIGAQPELDFGGRRSPDGQGFAAFGKVIEGMDVVRKINASPAKGQKLDPPIKILSIKRM
jgi:peptidyl-prolyl cis-trans isomerase A (cyclophilin A)